MGSRVIFMVSPTARYRVQELGRRVWVFVGRIWGMASRFLGFRPQNSGIWAQQVQGRGALDAENNDLLFGI